MKRIVDKAFVYTRSESTDIRATFRKAYAKLKRSGGQKVVRVPFKEAR